MSAFCVSLSLSLSLSLSVSLSLSLYGLWLSIYFFRHVTSFWPAYWRLQILLWTSHVSAFYKGTTWCTSVVFGTNPVLLYWWKIHISPNGVKCILHRLTSFLYMKNTDQRMWVSQFVLVFSEKLTSPSSDYVQILSDFFRCISFCYRSLKSSFCCF